LPVTSTGSEKKEKKMTGSRQVFTPFWITWHVLTLILLLLIPSLRFGIPVWELEANELFPWALLTAGYLLSVLIPSVNWLRGKPMQFRAITASTLGVFGLVLLALRVLDAQSSRTIVLGVFVTAVVMIPVPFSRRAIMKPAASLLATLAVAVLIAVAYWAYGPAPGTDSSMVESVLNTGYYNVRAVTYEGAIPTPAIRGGGVARIGDRYLLITGDGQLNVFGWDKDSDALAVKELPYRVPINGEEFSAAAGVPYEDSHDSVAGEGGAGEVQARWFRVGGVLVQQIDGRVRVFASHHFWKSSEACFVVRVSELEADQQAFLTGTPGATWKTLYETSPCLPVKGENRRRGTPFAGLFQGGRMILLDAHSLLLTVGDHGFDGVNARQSLPQDASAAYGKTMLIHLDDGSSETYTTGHRNPQGLFKDADGALWLTEQGPRGGDELNLLVRGRNYGWPFVTYGTDYASLVWPLTAPGGDDSAFEAPVYAWQPSIATSNLIRIEQDLFHSWKSDLLVASLAGESLWRVRLRDQHVVLVEPIHIGSRIRDLVEGADGRIVLWTDDATLVSLTPEAGTSGELLFDTRCGGCHRAIDDESHSIGPDLYGVVGRRIAAAKGYNDYSPALKALDGKWTETRLDAFLLNPRAVAPGTSMEFMGLEDQPARRAIVEYLRTLE
jgi:cytochrome c2